MQMDIIVFIFLKLEIEMFLMNGALWPWRSLLPKILRQVFQSFFNNLSVDRAKRHDFWPRLRLFFSPFHFPPKKRGKKKRRINKQTL